MAANWGSGFLEKDWFLDVYGNGGKIFVPMYYSYCNDMFLCIIVLDGVALKQIKWELEYSLGACFNFNSKKWIVMNFQFLKNRLIS